MKTSVKNLLAITLTAIVLTSSASISTAAENNNRNNNSSHNNNSNKTGVNDGNNNNVTSLNTVKDIRKVAVSGNVKVLLIQDKIESVEVYDNYYAKNAVVQQRGDVLNVTSYAAQRLTVVVHVNNLSSIDASGNSSVATYGKFNLLDLQVSLKDSATADINSNTVCLYSSVANGATLRLRGTADVYNATLGSLGRIDMAQFSAADSSISSAATVAASTPVMGPQLLKDMIIADDIAFLPAKK